MADLLAKLPLVTIQISLYSAKSLQCHDRQHSAEADQMTEGPEVWPTPWRQWKIRHGKLAEVYFLEWASEWIVHWSQNWEFVKVLELTGKFTIVIGIIVWFSEAGQRELDRQENTKSKHYRAWQIIDLARDSAGDAGRRDAIIDLHRDGVSLKGAPLANIFLDDMNLFHANMNKAILRNASLERACLKEARLSRADLEDANIAFASLENADLTESRLVNADLTSSNLDRAILNRAVLNGSNLSKASLRGAVLHDVNLAGANLKEADFSGAEMDDVSVLHRAKLCRTKMPDGTFDSSSCPNDASEAVPEKGDVGYSCKPQ